MPDMPIPAIGADARYDALCSARTELRLAWMEWLQTNPEPSVATHELMETQASIRHIHDAITGRIILGEPD